MQQLIQLHQQLYATEKLKGAINKQVEYLEVLIDADLKLLQTGDIRMADLVIAMNNYVTAKNLVVQNTISRYQIINQINYWNK